MALLLAFLLFLSLESSKRWATRRVRMPLSFNSSARIKLCLICGPEEITSKVSSQDLSLGLSSMTSMAQIYVIEPL